MQGLFISVLINFVRYSMIAMNAGAEFKFGISTKLLLI